MSASVIFFITGSFWVSLNRDFISLTRALLFSSAKTITSNFSPFLKGRPDNVILPELFIITDFLIAFTILSPLAYCWFIFYFVYNFVNRFLFLWPPVAAKSIQPFSVYIHASGRPFRMASSSDSSSWSGNDCSITHIDSFLAMVWPVVHFINSRRRY